MTKSRPWHVREPEGEEHRVIVGIALPVEEISDDVVHVGASDTFLVEHEDLRRTVHNGETISCLSETLGPPPSSSSQFQDRARCSKGGESVVHDGYLALPFELFLLTPVVPALSLPPLVVLRRPGPVIRPLLREQILVVHTGSIALSSECLNGWRASPRPDEVGHLSNAAR